MWNWAKAKTVEEACRALEITVQTYYRWRQKYGGMQPAMAKQYLFASRGVPEHIRSDNGPEFVAKGIRRWLVQAGVLTTTTGDGLVGLATRPRPRSRPPMFWQIPLRSIHQNTELPLT